MISVDINNIGITVFGHAGAGEYGKDIICAAVSTLTGTLIVSINSLCPGEIVSTIKNGFVTIHFKNLSEKGRTMIDSFFIGICGLCNEYPQYVQLA